MASLSITQIIELFLNREQRRDTRSSHDTLYIERNVLFSGDWQTAICADLVSQDRPYYIVGRPEAYERGVSERHARQVIDIMQDRSIQHVVSPRTLEGFGSLRTTDDEMLDYLITSMRERYEECNVDANRARQEIVARERETIALSMAVENIAKRFKIDPRVVAPHVWSVRKVATSTQPKKGPSNGGKQRTVRF